ncbi:hypothetical protein GCM10007938_32120 [Vibrio zhanjiangensis]|uniref:Prepilin-type N-terminal cleavage/methylation domain-containing protein n=1 Tax=Vibrio zhanjiangensis TaxID=1046128 RepID=A0ABQ6F3U0_9VIBR|nr:hypothetical protein [Vibrio zhanjiangensis]GLT19430.1 hypothetical protein GCM10007938_32120 [Vibrio zhanjiangensis]
MISKQTGTSLVEVLVALAIVALSGIGLVKFHIDIETKAGAAEKKWAAVHLAEASLETFSAYGHWPEHCEIKAQCDVSDDGQYQVLCLVEPILIDGAQVKQVQVQVCWQDGKHRVLSVRLNSVFAGHTMAKP